jgi:ATP-dependent Lon protease
VILPKRNEKNLVDVKPEIRKLLKFEFAETVDEVLAIALKAGGGGNHRGVRHAAKGKVVAAKSIRKV